MMVCSTMCWCIFITPSFSAWEHFKCVAHKHTCLHMPMLTNTYTHVCLCLYANMHKCACAPHANIMCQHTNTFNTHIHSCFQQHVFCSFWVFFQGNHGCQQTQSYLVFSVPALIAGCKITSFNKTHVTYVYRNIKFNLLTLLCPVQQFLLYILWC